MLLLVGSFIKENFKWIGPLLLVLSVVIVGHRIIDNMKQAAYNKGYAKRTEELQKAVAAENKKNREFEEKLGKLIADYGDRIRTNSNIRSEKEELQSKTIERLLSERIKYKQCLVDQDVTDARNKVRKLGPEIQQ